MNDVNSIKQRLHSQRLPFYESDIQHIQNTLFIINYAEQSLQAFPHLNKKVPITIVDKRIIR